MVSFNVTRRAPTLGSRDSWNGWRTISWSETTKEMIIIPRGATQLAMVAGVYPRLDAVGITADAFEEGDQVKDSVNDYWDIETIREVYWGDSFVSRECDLVKSVMYQADFGTTTWSKTRGSDPRYRTKVYLDTYLRTAQITKDDDSTTADFGVIFNNPPYQIWREFRGTSNMEGLFVVDQPKSTPLLDGLTRAPYGYEEHVPVHILTVNSTGCSGSALAWKMEAELRYVCETYPTGSLRDLDYRGKRDIDLGGMTLYDTEYVMTYKRSTTV